MYVYWNADKIHKKEFCNVIYNIATVFLMNDFPCVNKHARSFSKLLFQGKQGVFVIIHQNKLHLNATIH